MHRYVDLHYQYLTGSYACMLSCPISLRPFVILEATGPGPRGAQGQRDGGCRQHPCGGSDTWGLYAAHERSQDKQTKVIFMGFRCCPGRTMIVFFYNKKKKKPFASSQFQHVSTCFWDLPKLWEDQHLGFIYLELCFECHCGGICFFLCHYGENVLVLKRKVWGST